MTTPSKAALDLAVKPAGMTWEEFEKQAWLGNTRAIALAYAADLDKADKVGREVLALLDDMHHLSEHDQVLANEAAKLLRANLLPDPIDPDLLEAREIKKQWQNGSDVADSYFLAAIKRGRELQSKGPQS